MDKPPDVPRNDLLAPEVIAEAVVAALDHRRLVDETTHQKHHEYLQHIIESEKKRAERWDRLKESTIGWLIIVVLAGTGGAVWRIVARPWMD